MIFRRLGLIHRNQRGLTLIGLILAIAIGVVIVAATTTTIFQLISGSDRSSNHMTAVKQVQNAGYWISHDAQMAQPKSFVDTADLTPPEVLKLAWIEWDGKINEVTYTLIGGELQRSHSISENTETNIVAEYIELANCDFTDTDEDGVDDTLVFTVIATVSGLQPASETRVYEVIPRPDTE